MTVLGPSLDWDSTSAGEAPRNSQSSRPRSPKGVLTVLLGTLADSSTSCGHSSPVAADILARRMTASAGSADLAPPPIRPDRTESTRQAVNELRKLSGLTWEQLARLFGVSRRSVHFWASGKPLSEAHEQAVLRVLAILRAADRGDARSNRALLLESEGVASAFELLRLGRFVDAAHRLGTGPGLRRLPVTPLSPEAAAARKPPPPDELVDALDDRGHRDIGRGRPARTVRNERAGRT